MNCECVASSARHYGKRGFRLEATQDPNSLTDAIAKYFAGELDAIDALQIKTGGTRFQREVWRALRKISRGTRVPMRNLLTEAAAPPRFVPWGLPMAQIR